MAKNNEEIAQDYVRYIIGKRYDEDQPSERSLSIAPDGINAQEKGIFCFDKIENPQKIPRMHRSSYPSAMEIYTGEHLAR